MGINDQLESKFGKTKARKDFPLSPEERAYLELNDRCIHTELGHLRSAMRFAVNERIIDRAPSIERPAKPTPI